MRSIKYLLFVLFVTLSACEGDEDIATDCVDPSKKRKEGACPLVEAPVCGCDGETYGNFCFAEAAGLKSWSEGECK